MTVGGVLIVIGYVAVVVLGTAFGLAIVGVDAEDPDDVPPVRYGRGAAPVGPHVPWL